MDKLNKAITAIKAGDKQTGRELLNEVIKAEPRNEYAWLWMTRVVDTRQRQLDCLKKVLEINPSNKTAQQLLTKLDVKQSPKVIKKLNTSDTKQCPYCGETIKASAVICRFCERDLATGKRTNQTIVVQQKKRNWFVTILAFISLFVILCICGLFGFSFLSSLGRSTQSEAARYVKVVEWDCHSDSIGNMILEGRIQNTHQKRALRAILLRGKVADDFDNVVNTNTSYADSDIIAPGATSSFTVYVDNPDNETHCVISVESARFN